MILVFSLIIMLVVFFAVISRRLNIPLIIIALAIGIIFGSDFLNILYLDDNLFAQNLANFALIFILFAGGFSTKSFNLRPVFMPTLLLATVGVLSTAIITAIFFSFFTGWGFLKTLLLCAIISSTDSAAVFSVLKNRAIKKRITSITEIESAVNDPMAIVFTVFILQLVVGTNLNAYYSFFNFVWQLIGGAGIGIGIGALSLFLFHKIKEIDIGYFYLLLIGIILFSFSLADLLNASGMLSAFFAGYVLGNKKMPYKSWITSFTEALSFIANVSLFVLLGLLVFPKNLGNVWLLGVALFFILAFVGRPITVFLCTIFTKISFREKIFLSWSGIRGAVPIVLATYPAAMGLEDNHEFFNIIFLAVALSIVLQGTSIGKLADFLKLSLKKKQRPKQTMELVTIHDTDYDLIEIFIDEDIYQGQVKVSELDLPIGTTITMINRGNQIIAPSGKTMILPGDTLSVLVENKKIDQVIKKILESFAN